MPVVENQLCGNLIFAPQRSWLPSHYLNKSLHDAGEGELGSNFRIYDNDLDKLIAQIQQCRDNYQPQQVLSDFKAQYPQLYHGDLAALELFIGKVASGEINGQSHRHYAGLNEGIRA